MSLSQMMQERNQLLQEGQSHLSRIKEVQYQLKVATVENNENKISSLNAEVQVLAKMAQEGTSKINALNASIETQQTSMKAEAKTLYVYSQLILAASLLAFFMPMEVGFLWFIGCLIVGGTMYKKYETKKAYAAGISEEQLENMKKEVKTELAEEERVRNALAKAIAAEMKK